MPPAILPDVLQPGLRAVFCGMAASKKSARVSAYYAGPGNKFWGVLHLTGLTPLLLAPAEFREAVRWGIGFTDMIKTQSGSDGELDLKYIDLSAERARVRHLILHFQPRVLAFSSKHAAVLFSGRPNLSFGLQPDFLGQTAVWVLPSTSGSNNGHWAKLAHHWHDLADFLNRGETGWA